MKSQEFVDLKDLKRKLIKEKEQEQKEEFNPQEELAKIIKNNKTTLDKIKDELVKYKEIISLVILPPRPEKEYVGKVFLTAIIDDINIEGEKLPRVKELEDLITKTIESNKDFFVTVKTLTKVWEELNSGLWDMYFPILGSEILIDKKAVIEAIKIGFVLRDIVKKQFDKYLLTMYLFGSVTKGEARPDSDIDFAFLFDDTDLEGMSRASTREQLFNILNKMANDAKLIVDINPNREIHIQVHLLTDFWKSIKEANPVSVNFLRDGVVFYDKGVFIPWKRLLMRGEIKPTAEAIDQYFRAAEELDQRIFLKLRDILMEDLFWAVVTATQAVLMALGYEPPYPKALPSFVNSIKEKEGFFSEEDVEFLKDVVKYRKDLEHGKIKELDGKTIDLMKERASNYFNKMKKLYRDIILNYRKKEVKDLFKEAKKLLKLVYNLEDLNLLKVLVDKGLVSNLVVDYLPVIEKLEKNVDLEEGEVEIAWKGLKLLNRDLEEKYGEALKKKVAKLITKGFLNNKEITLFFTRDGFYLVSEDGKAIKYFYNSDKKIESEITQAFDEVMKLAENLEDIKIDLKKLAELGIVLEF
jgi:predicted nucleotidyltransferase